MYFVRDAGPRSLLTEQIYRGRVSVVVVVVAFSKGGGGGMEGFNGDACAYANP